MSVHRPDEIVTLPNAVWGSLGQGYREQIYARSAVVGDKLCAKIVQSCRAWGRDSDGFASHRSYFQVPVESRERSPGMPGGVLAVGVTPTTDNYKRRALLFHAVFLSDSDFAEVGAQSHGLWSSGAFVDRWDGKPSLPFVEVSVAAVQPPPLPALAAGQISALTRELEHILKGESIRYTAFTPEPDLVEHLRLLQLGLPESLRRSLGFSVFLGEGALVGVGSSFAIAAVPGPGSFQAGGSTPLPCQRRAIGTSGAIRRFVAEYAQHLERRDLAGLLDLGRRAL